MIKAIFFDSGNVLIGEGYFPGVKEYEVKHGIADGKLYESAHDRPYWTQYSLGNISMEDYYKEIKKDFPGEVDTEELRQTIYKNFVGNQELFELIKTLKGKFILGVISNNPKDWFDYCNKTFGLDELFSVKIVSGEVHVRKPDPKIFSLALEKAGVNAEESIYVDDRPDRVQGAEAVGINIIIYKTVSQLEKDLLPFG